MAYDSDRGRIVLFGGLWNPGQPPYSGTLGDTWELPTGYAGTFSTTATYGVGCGAPLLTIAPQPGSRPTIGFTQTSNIAGIPAVVGGFAAVAWGFSNQVWGSVPLPASLSSLGLTGCSLLTSVDGELGSSTTPTSATTARHTFFVPADPALVQVRVFLQAWTLSPGANPAEIILSNGLELRIGDG